MEYPKRIPIEGAGVLVLRDPDEKLQPPHYSNLCLEGPDGRVVWWAKTPVGVGHDWFMDVTCEDGEIRAGVWSGYLVWIDPATGTTLRTVFTK